jgi:HSP20 family protein
MSNLTRWNPARDFLSMSEAMDRLFDQAFVPFGNGPRSLTPSVDVIENDNEVLVKAEMPGFNPNDVDIRVEGNILTMHGEVKQESEKQEGQYHVRERRQSSFHRSIPLPVEVNADQAKAEFDNGVLTLTLPKNENAKPKRISITAKSGK